MNTEQNHDIFTKFVHALRALFLPPSCSGALEPKLEQLPGPHPTSYPTPSQSEFDPLIHSFPKKLVLTVTDNTQYVAGTRLGAGRRKTVLLLKNSHSSRGHRQRDEQWGCWGSPVDGILLRCLGKWGQASRNRRWLHCLIPASQGDNCPTGHRILMCSLSSPWAPALYETVY